MGCAAGDIGASLFCNRTSLQRTEKEGLLDRYRTSSFAGGGLLLYSKTVGHQNGNDAPCDVLQPEVDGGASNPHHHQRTADSRRDRKLERAAASA